MLRYVCREAWSTAVNFTYQQYGPNNVPAKLSRGVLNAFLLMMEGGIFLAATGMRDESPLLASGMFLLAMLAEKLRPKAVNGWFILLFFTTALILELNDRVRRR